MARLNAAACVAALGIAALPTVASACRLTPMPIESERNAGIEQRQAQAWEASSLVYLAEVVEWRMTDTPGDGFGRVRLKLAPLMVLKGEASPQTLELDYPAMDSRCGRDFMDIESHALAGDRFVIYASTSQPSSDDDIWSQDWLEVRDPSAIRALANHGWVQRGGWRDRER